MGGFTETLDLKQDERDIIRQEYSDYVITIPNRRDIRDPANPAFRGNYNKIVDTGMEQHYNNTMAKFTHAFASALPPKSPPGVSITSAYRNPRRNKYAKSTFVNSPHVYGLALDLQPSVPTERTPENYAQLQQAGHDAGNYSQCENAPSQKCECTMNGITHVHIQWSL